MAKPLLTAQEIHSLLLWRQLIDSLLDQRFLIAKQEILFGIVMRLALDSGKTLQHFVFVQPPFYMIEGMTGGNGENIGFGLVDRSQFVAVPPYLDEDLLGDLFGMRFRPDHLQHEEIDPLVITAEQLRKGVFVTR